MNTAHHRLCELVNGTGCLSQLMTLVRGSVVSRTLISLDRITDIFSILYFPKADELLSLLNLFCGHSCYINSSNLQKLMLFYRPQRSCGKGMFLHLSVSHSVHRGGCVYPSMHWGRHPRPPRQTPPGRHTPSADHPSGASQHALGQTSPPPPRRPLYDNLMTYSRNKKFSDN